MSHTAADIPVAGPSSVPNRPREPQPGDGAFLTHNGARPGDGVYLRGGPRGFSRGVVRGTGLPRVRGRGSNGAANGPRRVNGNMGNHLPHGGPVQVTYPNGNVQGLPNGRNSTAPNPLPHRPEPAARLVDPTVAPEATTSTSNSSTEEQRKAISGNRGRGRVQKVPKTKGRSDEGGVTDGVKLTDKDELDPFASPFVPPSPGFLHTNGDSRGASTSTSRASSPGPSSRNGNTQRKPVNGHAKQLPRDQGSKSANPPVPHSSRRAAFESQTRLTGTSARANGAVETKTDGSGKVNGDGQLEEYRDKQERVVEKDDLISRLTRGLQRGPFLECPIVSQLVSR